MFLLRFWVIIKMMKYLHEHHHNASLVPVQPRKTRPFITDSLLIGRKESSQTNKQKHRHTAAVTWPTLTSELHVNTSMNTVWNTLNWFSR